LLVSLDEEKVGYGALDEDLFMDSYLFVLAHEIAHCVLGHLTELKSLFGFTEPISVTVRTDPSEHEADLAAANIISQFALSRADMRGNSSEYEYYIAWLGFFSAVTAIYFWENGLFIRLSDSHPPASERLRLLNFAFAKRWRFLRPIRRA